jgi:sorting nexin-29
LHKAVRYSDLALEKAVRYTETDAKGTVHNNTVQILAYANDVVIVGRKKEIMKKLMKAARVVGLTVNMQKAKYTQVTKIITKVLEIYDQEYYRLIGFKYLETFVSDGKDITTEIKQRKIVSNKTSCGLKKQLNSTNLK